MPTDAVHVGTNAKAQKMIAAREYALEVLKLATGKPTPGALLLAYDYRSALLTLHDDALGAGSDEHRHLIQLALGLLRAAYDVACDILDIRTLHDTYQARLDAASHAVLWATAYVHRVNPPKQTHTNGVPSTHDAYFLNNASSFMRGASGAPDVIALPAEDEE